MNNQRKTLFETLHKDYHGMVNQMCLGFMKGDQDLAKDLSQEIFINIWNALGKFKGESSHKTWLYRTTVNTCLKYIRDKKDTNRIAIEDINQPVTEGTSDIVDPTFQTLYKAIGQLMEIDRLIIMMVLDELEYDEISKIVGISSVNLRVKIHRIKKQLKKILENE